MKPANILIDVHGQSFVMDFGLAREVAVSSGMTMTGQFMGTPEYMSPEQATGRTNRSGPPSDLFSLGVVLYEVLTGRLPFHREALRELMNAIAETDPERPSRMNSRVHADVETICLKALEKDPTRRYPSLTDLAADLGRYLEGEPIHARPLTRAALLLRQAWKRRAILLPSAAAVALGLAWAGWSIASSRRMDEARQDQARAEREAEQAREVLARAPFVLDVLRRFGELSATLRTLQAINADDRLDADEKVRRFAEEWPPVQAFIDGTPRDATSQATMKALAGWARALAGRVAEWEEAKGLDPREGLSAAIADCDEAVRLNPHHADALNARGRARLRLSLAEAARDADPREGLKRAIADYGECLRRAPGKADVLANRSVAWRRLAEADEVRGTDASASYARAEADGDEALRRDPELGYAWITRGNARLSAARAEEARGKDAREAYGRAIADFDEVLRRNPEDRGAYLNRGVAHHQLASALFMRALDPHQACLAAIADYGEALRRNPKDADALSNRANSWLLLGQTEVMFRQDPREPFKGEIADADAALAIQPDEPLARTIRSMACMRMGQALAAQGLDPEASYAEAIDGFSKALERDPSNATAWGNRALAKRFLGEALMARREDPRPTLEGAIVDVTECVRRSGSDPGGLLARAGILFLLGRAEAERKVDSAPRFEAAVRDCDAAIARNPSLWSAFVTKGRVFDAMGEPSKAVEAYRGALRVGPNAADIGALLDAAEEAAQEKEGT